MGLTEKSWANVSLRTLRSAWDKEWPIIIQERDFESCAEELQPSVDPVMILTAKSSKGWHKDSSKVEKLVEEHSELSTEELQ